MLSELRRFFGKEERVYAATFILLTLLYVVLLLLAKPSQKTETSGAMDEFKAAEKQWQSQLSNEEAMEQYVEKHPAEAALFNLMSVLFIAAFAFGTFFNVALILRKPLRDRLWRAPPGESGIHWSFVQLCQVILFWILASFALSFVMAMAQDYGWLTMSKNVILLLHTTIMDLLGVVVILAVIYRASGTWRDLGFRMRLGEFWREAGAGLMGYICVLPVFFVVLILLVVLAKLAGYEPPAHPLVEIFIEEEVRAPWVIIYSVILGSVLGPVIEEIFFRGFAYSLLKAKWGRSWAMITTSLFFAFIHQNEFAFLPIFVLGMGLAWLYELRGNLVAPIFMHVAHNCLFMGYFFAAKNVIMQTGS